MIGILQSVLSDNSTMVRYVDESKGSTDVSNSLAKSGFSRARVTMKFPHLAQAASHLPLCWRRRDHPSDQSTNLRCRNNQDHVPPKC